MKIKIAIGIAVLLAFTTTFLGGLLIASALNHIGQEKQINQEKLTPEKRKQEKIILILFISSLFLLIVNFIAIEYITKEKPIIVEGNLRPIQKDPKLKKIESILRKKYGNPSIKNLNYNSQRYMIVSQNEYNYILYSADNIDNLEKTINNIFSGKKEETFREAYDLEKPNYKEPIQIEITIAKDELKNNIKDMIV